MSITRIAMQCAQLLERGYLEKTSGLDLRASSDILVRFKIWAGNVGVFAPGNASIDYRLRDDKDLADVLTRLLGRLKKHLEQAVRPPLREEPEDEQNQVESSTSSDLSDSSSELGLDPDEAGTLPYIDVGGQSRHNPIAQANGIIDYLYRLSVVFRKPVSSAENDKVRQFIAKQSEEEAAKERSDFERYVQWMIPHRFPNAPKVLADRLVATLVFRRMKLLYRRRHREKLMQGLLRWSTAQPPSEDMLIGETNHPFTHSSLESPRPTTWNPHTSIQTATYARSHSISTTRASSVNRSILADCTALSEITQAAVARRGKLDIPYPPHDVDARVKNFPCPYCSRFLEEEERREPRWARHVLEDIEPYICLFEDCTDEYAMFQSPGEWLKHMQWQHTVVWCCQAPGHELNIYDSQVRIEEHIRRDHPNSFTESQLSMLIQRSGRPVADTFEALAQSFRSHGSSDDVNQCPLCRNFPCKLERHDLETQNLEDHILEHLESIALLSLPEEDKFCGKSDTLESISSETVILDVIDLPPATFEESDLLKPVQKLSLNSEYVDPHILTPSPLEHVEQWSTICKTIQDQRKKKDPLIFPQPDSDKILKHWRLASMAGTAPMQALASEQSGKPISFYLDRQSQVQEALQLTEQVVETRKKPLGEKHPETLHSMHDLAIRYSKAGQGAPQLTEQVMEVRKRTLGVEHPKTLRSMHNLAITYSKAGRLQEALQLTEKVIEVRKRTLGEKHPDTLDSMHNLAMWYNEAGRWQEALQLTEQVAEAMKRTLGEDYPGTLRSMHNLAITYSKASRLQEALQLTEQVIEVRKRILGEKHPDTLDSMHNLALWYNKAGRWQEALQLTEQVAEAMKRTLGEDHPGTLRSMHNLAIIYSEAGQLQEALQLTEQVMEVRKRILGEDHPGTLRSMHNLAIRYSEAGKRQEALQLTKEVVEARKRTLGKEHPDTLGSMHSLAIRCSEAGRRQEALQLTEQVVGAMKRTLGEDHPETLRSMHNLVIRYSEVGRGQESLQLMEQVVEARKKTLGGDHSETIESRNMLEIMHSLGDLLVHTVARDTPERTMSRFGVSW